MKRYICFLVVFLLLIAQSLFAEMCPGSEGWEVDGQYGFNVAFVGDDQTKAAENNFEIVTPLEFVDKWLPDITNINLKEFLKMGFEPDYMGPIEGKNLFIKLYKLPKSFSHLKIIGKIPGLFRLDLPLGGAELSTFMTSREKIYLKKCLIDNSDARFSKEKPFPPMLVEKHNPFGQKKFGESIFFYSIYLKPSTTPEDSGSPSAKSSAGGVIAFHNALLNGYKKSLVEVEGPDKNLRYFVGATKPAKGKEPAKLSVLSLPVKPLVFDNWEDLPMPYKPGNKFLTSLLLLTQTEYISENEDPEKIIKITDESFKRNWKKGKSLIFEFGSVLSDN